MQMTPNSPKSKLKSLIFSFALNCNYTLAVIISFNFIINYMFLYFFEYYICFNVTNIWL